MRLEAYKPTQLPIDSSFHFGASTRNYIIRERPQTGIRPIIDEIEKAGEETEGGLLGLPETETELDVSIFLLIEELTNKRELVHTISDFVGNLKAHIHRFQIIFSSQLAEWLY